MGIKANKNNKRLRLQVYERITKEIEQRIVEYLEYIGIEAVNMARANIMPKKKGGTSYYDDTGNLRSSIGYVIAKNGKVIQDSGFEPVNPSGVKGSAEGRAYAESIALKYREYVLVVVAGMYYAEFVEKKVYDVVTFTEIEAKALARTLFSALAKEISG